jgi:hypothetical protein
MPDPKTLWLSLANLILAGLVILCLAAAGFAILSEIVTRLRRHRAIDTELDEDMKRWFGDRHHTDVPHRRH